MTAKQYAEQLYNKYYAIIFEYGEEMSQEIVISQLAKKCAIQSVYDMLTRYYNGMKGNKFLIDTFKELERL